MYLMYMMLSTFGRQTGLFIKTLYVPSDSCTFCNLTFLVLSITLIYFTFLYKMEIPECIRAKKRKRPGNVREETSRNKNSGGPYKTIKKNIPKPGKFFTEEVGETY